ncbi:hypothetical protein JWZ98_22310 [Methylomonas sp. EFPC1]|uniref:hypothetical protein n=1 Tax=Methylomonas sp. EFPC1 TaxID=2812647 RepID=UPI001967CF21|nr:hypothetical protein [Methylomonas sp. EFPC1]QSB01329.1 hypothetical protein JWZ98_22310 [Methylomonas sp. EFPC1]
MIELPANVESRLIHAAQDEGQNLAQFVDRLLEIYLEDKTDAQTAEAAYREFIVSGEAAIPLDKLIAEHGV